MKKNISIIFLFIALTFISFINVIDINLFLSTLSSKFTNISMQDIVIYMLYGLTSSRVNLIDIIRFSIPFILCISFINSYLSDILESNTIYLNIIRYKSYSSWIKTYLFKMTLFVILFYTYYYINLIIISSIFTKNVSGFTDIFYYLNRYITNTNFFQLLIYQYFLSIFSTILLTLINLLLSLVLKNINKSFIVVIVTILILTALGKYDIINPLMLCKHYTINYNFNINPISTLTFHLLFSFIIYISLVRCIKLLVRRTGL